MTTDTPFLRESGRIGPFGALMDLYAAAAEDFLQTLATVPPDVYVAERESSDPDTKSPRAITEHVCRAARGYAVAIRRARGMDDTERNAAEHSDCPDVGTARRRLTAALRYTEDTLKGYWDADYETVRGHAFRVSWGPEYDAEMLLEHAVLHLMRHRRQLQRWG